MAILCGVNVAGLLDCVNVTFVLVFALMWWVCVTVPILNQQTRETISDQKTSHEHNNK